MLSFFQFLHHSTEKTSCRLVHSVPDFFQDGKSERYCCISSKPSNLFQVLISSLCLLSSLSLWWCGERGSAGVTAGPSLKDLFQFSNLMLFCSEAQCLLALGSGDSLMFNWSSGCQLVFYLKAGKFCSWAAVLNLTIENLAELTSWILYLKQLNLRYLP